MGIFRMEKKITDTIFKVVILGTESTGKTTLARQLADSYQTVYVEEHARLYLNDMNEGEEYNSEDLLNIAQAQMFLEDIAIEDANEILFYDTDITVLKIWSEERFGYCDPWILEQYMEREYDLYFLMDVDLEWEADPLREHPAEKDRKRLFKLYKTSLESRNKRYAVISGQGDNRLKKAQSIIFMHQMLYS